MFFFERWGVSLRPKAKGAHANICERHHELLRRQFHVVKAQCKEEGLAVTDEAIMQESTFAKNALITVHGRTPYNGLLGRTPNLLSEFESPSLSNLSDTAGGAEGGHTRHAIRLRELSIQSMVEGSARERLRRAATTQTRTSGELLGLQIGDAVDLFRQPANKDLVGWRGPAEVLSTAHLEDGYVEVKWGGRTMSVRVADLRRHLI